MVKDLSVSLKRFSNLKKIATFFQVVELPLFFWEKLVLDKILGYISLKESGVQCSCLVLLYWLL